MLQPKRTPFRKYQKMKGSFQKTATTGGLMFGIYGIQALHPCKLPARSLEAARRVITRTLKRQGKLYIRVFPDVLVTRKPQEVRMGKGKGNPHHWIARVRKGEVLFEMSRVSKTAAQEACALLSEKFKVPLRFIDRSQKKAEWGTEN
tara:strand:+ start:5357 stop:5797 length:441 start_codon:yes stop_codon:yes gene_type:complete